MKCKFIKKIGIGCLISGLTLCSTILTSAKSAESEAKLINDTSIEESQENFESQTSTEKTKNNDSVEKKETKRKNNKKKSKSKSKKENNSKVEDKSNEDENKASFSVKDWGYQVYDEKWNTENTTLLKTNTNIPVSAGNDNALRLVPNLVERNDKQCELNGEYDLSYLDDNDNQIDDTSINKCGVYKVKVKLPHDKSAKTENSVVQQFNVVGQKKVNTTWYNKYDWRVGNERQKEFEYSAEENHFIYPSLKFNDTALQEQSSSDDTNGDYTVKYYKIDKKGKSNELKRDEINHAGKYIAKVNLTNKGIEAGYNLGEKDGELLTELSENFKILKKETKIDYWQCGPYGDRMFLLTSTDIWGYRTYYDGTEDNTYLRITPLQFNGFNTQDLKENKDYDVQYLDSDGNLIDDIKIKDCGTYNVKVTFREDSNAIFTGSNNTFTQQFRIIGGNEIKVNCVDNNNNPWDEVNDKFTYNGKNQYVDLILDKLPNDKASSKQNNDYYTIKYYEVDENGNINNDKEIKREEISHIGKYAVKLSLTENGIKAGCYLGKGFKNFFNVGRDGQYFITDLSKIFEIKASNNIVDVTLTEPNGTKFTKTKDKDNNLIYTTYYDGTKQYLEPTLTVLSKDGISNRKLKYGEYVDDYRVIYWKYCDNWKWPREITTGSEIKGPGFYEAEIRLKDNDYYTIPEGNEKIRFKIDKSPIEVQTSYEYTGSDPKLKFKSGGKELLLEEGKDYVVNYEPKYKDIVKEVGTYNVNISLKDNYKTKNYIINNPNVKINITPIQVHVKNWTDQNGIILDENYKLMYKGKFVYDLRPQYVKPIFDRDLEGKYKVIYTYKNQSSNTIVDFGPGTTQPGVYTARIELNKNYQLPIEETTKDYEICPDTDGEIVPDLLFDFYNYCMSQQ